MNQDQALIALCEALLEDRYVTEQDGWQKIILIGDVAEGHVSLGGYSFDAQAKCQMVAPAASRLKALKQLHAVMKAEDAMGRGWLSCMIRMARSGEIGADFEYSDAKRWSHTPENYQDRIRQYAAMPV